MNLQVSGIRCCTYPYRESVSGKKPLSNMRTSILRALYSIPVALKRDFSLPVPSLEVLHRD